MNHSIVFIIIQVFASSLAYVQCCYYNGSSTDGPSLDLTSLVRSSNYYELTNITLEELYPNQNHTFNITFNICGGLGKGFDCGDQKWATNSVCLKSVDGNIKEAIGTNTARKFTYEHGEPILNYYSKSIYCGLQGSNVPYMTSIEFVCDESADAPRAEFISYTNCVFIIQMKTKIVCIPKHLEFPNCTVTSEDGKIYDLSLLRKRKHEKPWTTATKLYIPWARHASKKSEEIYINVCGPIGRLTSLGLNKPDYCGSQIDTAACKIDSSDNSTVSLGKFDSSLTIDKNKALLLTYNGTDMVTKISFICSTGNLDTLPILVDSFKLTKTKIMYEFEWETAAACPLVVSTGTNCKVFDKLGLSLDLNPLSGVYPVIAGKYKYYLSICKPLKANLCQSIDDGACQIELKDSKETSNKRSIGKANSELSYFNGVLKLTYYNGTEYNSKSDTSRKTEISFICDYQTNVGAPQFIQEINRTYIFRWHTKYACSTPPNYIHCVWENGTHIVDMTPLALVQGNHFATAIARNLSSNVFFLNVCRPLNPMRTGSVNNCAPSSGVCKVEPVSGKVLNLGEPKTGLIHLPDDTISLHYVDGDICPHNSSIRLSTLLRFICDESAGSGLPRLINDPIDDLECRYVFEWKTSVACNIVGLIPMNLNNCTFQDKRTGAKAFLSDLTKLNEGHTVLINGDNSSQFNLNICSMSSNFGSPVCKNSGVCFKRIPSKSKQKPDIKNFGLRTSGSFYYDGETLKLHYANGSDCANSTSLSKYSSEIIFKCNKEVGSGKPVLRSSNFKCSAIFDWETDAVCDLKIPEHPCVLLTNNSYYDLRILSTGSHAWSINDDIDNGTYWLNVCHKLPSKLVCPNQFSASCYCRKDPIKNISICYDPLGDTRHQNLSLDENNNLVLKYYNGSSSHCNSNSVRLKARTEILFKCGSVTGLPKFIKKVATNTECIYYFEWSTFAACPYEIDKEDLLIDQNATGYLYDKRFDSFIDLRPLLKESFNITGINDHTDDTYYYLFNFLNATLPSSFNCGSAAVCQTKGTNSFNRDIGSLNSQKFVLKGNELQIILESWNTKQKCGKNSRKNVTTIITLRCSLTADIGHPIFVYESYDCDYRFDWDTKYLCLEHFIPNITTVIDDLDSILSHDSHIEKSGSTSWLLIIFLLLLGIILASFILIVINEDRRNAILYRLRRYFGPKLNTTFHYSQLSTNDANANHPDVAFISTGTNFSSSPYSNTTTPKDFTQSRHLTVPYSIYDDSDVDLLT